MVAQSGCVLSMLRQFESKCVGCYTATEGFMYVFCWKTADLTCLSR